MVKLAPSMIYVLRYCYYLLINNYMVYSLLMRSPTLSNLVEKWILWFPGNDLGPKKLVPGQLNNEDRDESIKSKRNLT